MKISKKNNKVVATDEVTEVVEVAPVEPAAPEEQVSKYQVAYDHIKAAIESLSALEDDQVARDSMANLSVVLIDLVGEEVKATEREN